MDKYLLHIIYSTSDLCKTGSKSTFCYEIKREYNYDYVLLDDLRERELSISDSESFLQIHKWPLIIDEIQYAPELFAVLESNVNKEKLEKGSNYGMYLITGSSTYELMKGVSESLAGRVSIIRMFQLSTREIFGCEEYVFDIHPIESMKRANDFKLDVHDLFSLIIRGMYLELLIVILIPIPIALIMSLHISKEMYHS